MRIWVLIAGVLALLVLLKWQFPDAAVSIDDRLHILYLLLFLLIIAGGWGINRLPAAKTWKYAAIWALIVGGLMLAYYGLAALDP